jgi:hypothetical protein
LDRITKCGASRKPHYRPISSQRAFLPAIDDIEKRFIERLGYVTILLKEKLRHGEIERIVCDSCQVERSCNVCKVRVSFCPDIANGAAHKRRKR